MYYISHIEFSDLLIFSLFMNIIMYVFLGRQEARRSHSIKLFLSFLLSIILATLTEILSWLIAIPDNGALVPYHYLVNILFFAFNLLPASLGLRYLDYIVFASTDKAGRKLLLYLAPVFLNLIFIVYNFFSDGFLFSVDASNVYHRGIATYIGNAFTVLFAAVVVLRFFRNKQTITGRITQVILILTLLPVVGVVLQMLFLGLSLGLPAYTLAIFICFLLMERNELLKDPLTLLNSRKQMENRLQYKLRSQEPFTVIMIDVNEFKNINDVHGHTIGDKVLKDVSRILVSGANYEDFVCRYGGDEFFVILESPEDIGRSYIRRTDHALQEYSAGKPYQASLSYGLVYVDHPVKYSVEELIHITDRLMYDDKKRA